MTAVLDRSRRSAIVWAWLISAVFFALLHLPSYNWNLLQVLMLIGLARLILTLAYIKTKNIWVSTGHTSSTTRGPSDSRCCSRACRAADRHCQGQNRDVLHRRATKKDGDRMSSRVSRLYMASLVVAVAAALACGKSPAAPTDPLAGFALSGDPASPTGATWTYRARVSGISYDLEGVLYKPPGAGPFPAVIISHGAGGSAASYSRTIAPVMVGWGLVCIATNYTHAGGVPLGSPGTSADAGASLANVQRARRLADILRGLGYVDMTRLALHGHSMGAFVTTATAGGYPDLFRAVSHTAGGMTPDSLGVPSAPTAAQVAGIRAPYQMHHGDRDFVVPLVADQLLAAALQTRGVPNELVLYPGASHDDVRADPIVLERIREWYQKSGVL